MNRVIEADPGSMRNLLKKLLELQSELEVSFAETTFTEGRDTAAGMIRDNRILLDSMAYTIETYTRLEQTGVQAVSLYDMIGQNEGTV